jgi:hypothetical protein
MTNNEHKSELVSLLTDLMKEIDLKPLHPKNKILLYSRYVLSKLSWHFTKAAIQKTWISENLDSVSKPGNTFVDGLRYLFLDHLVTST